MQTLVIGWQLDGRWATGLQGCLTAAHNFTDGSTDLLLAGNKIHLTRIDTIGVNHLYFVKSQTRPTEEEFVNQVASVAGNYSRVIAPATPFGKAFLPRLASAVQKLNNTEIPMVSGITALNDDAASRPTYTGQLIQTVHLPKRTFLSLHPTEFVCQTQNKQNGQPEIHELDRSETGLDRPETGKEWQKSFWSDAKQVDEEIDLESAQVVVGGGKGVGSAEDFKRLEQFAHKIGAALGGSREAVESGFIPSKYQIGQSSRTISPKYYFAFGISGAPQHMSAIARQTKIIAINTNAQAPIMEQAHYALAMDWRQFVEEFETALDEDPDLLQIMW